MPTIPALGISSRSDPKVRYIKRSVSEVATKNLNSVFPWKSYSKQGSPSPDKDGMTGNGEEEERRKMFPSQDDKTNAFMDSLAQRINYMTSKIASMSNSVIQVNGTQNHGQKPASDEVPRSKSTYSAEDNSEDSGLSTRDSSHVVSELATPDDGLDMLGQSDNQTPSKCASPKSPKSPKSSSSAASSKVSSPSKSKYDVLDEEADACIIEANHRGFSILHALQERHRRSMYLEDAVVENAPVEEIVPTPEVLSQV